MYLIYFALWVIFNGNFTLEICLFGLVIAAVILVFSCKFMGYSLAKEKRFYKNFFLFLRYCYLLVTEIARANVQVIHMILTQEEEIQPELVHFQTNLKTSMGKALLANAITLTPGTITVMLEGDEYTVHCLDENLAEGINESEFAEYIRKFEEE